ncbi:L-type lectin-domain containing receptor kinase IV.1 [Acorus gramineus]|uniref:non-specific serine/threonine protein kinase n=1 Tax=Acorus gramineus TaxID=55184 RepID=A0AAV9BJW7_ACOGR|nr:L-type lectin-domain containing receptor kinase IV.1 [Acorus gramineus]
MRIFVLEILLCILILARLASSTDDDDFLFHGFRDAKNLSLDGAAEITQDGLLKLTNTTVRLKGHAFHTFPLRFHGSRGGGNTTVVSSFSTSFVFAIVPMYSQLGGHGITFAVSPSKDLSWSLPIQYLGLFNVTDVGSSSNHMFAVELDTVQNTEFGDIDENHVGIDVNSLRSVNSSTAGYYGSAGGGGGFKSLSLISGDPMRLWIEFDGARKQLNVTLAPLHLPKPLLPLLSVPVDLSDVVSESAYVGFSASTGRATSDHYILGWSFRLNGEAREIDPSKLPSLPPRGPKKKPKLLTIGLPLILSAFVLAAVVGLGFAIHRKMKFAEVFEDWELKYGVHRFSYKELYEATHGFRDSGLLGVGGFGRVYKGELPASKTAIAVKRVSHDSRQGMQEFVAEIASIGQLRHRHLVRLLGYCRREGELLLVYDYMPNGSLDKLLFGGPSLSWKERFRIIKGVASGLLYLHEECGQVVLHRDVKPSNVLLDGEMNARLGDFGLARLYDHGTDPETTTHVVGTFGYLAPELTMTRKASTATDVFAFGVFLLEVPCGRRPIAPIKESETEQILVDWVLQHWMRGTIVETVDASLGGDVVVGEIELVLKLGLLCSHQKANGRPTMRQVMQFLEGEMPLPDVPMNYMNAGSINSDRYKCYDDFMASYTSSENVQTQSSFDTESLLSRSR